MYFLNLAVKGLSLQQCVKCKPYKNRTGGRGGGGGEMRERGVGIPI